MHFSLRNVLVCCSLYHLQDCETISLLILKYKNSLQSLIKILLETIRFKRSKIRASKL